MWEWVNSLQHKKFLDLSKFRAFADDKRIATKKLKFVLEQVENMVELDGCPRKLFKPV